MENARLVYEIIASIEGQEWVSCSSTADFVLSGTYCRPFSLLFS